MWEYPGIEKPATEILASYLTHLPQCVCTVEGDEVFVKDGGYLLWWCEIETMLELYRDGKVTFSRGIVRWKS